MNPVLVGKTRAKQLFLKEGDYSVESDTRPGDGVTCLQVHGDGAVSGQVNAARHDAREPS